MDPEAVKKLLKISSVAGAVFWTVIYLLLAIMLTASFGVWPIVAWPLTVYLWGLHLRNVLVTYQGFVKPKAKQINNVTFNVSSDLTAEEVADAARRAVSNEVKYGLTK